MPPHLRHSPRFILDLPFCKSKNTGGQNIKCAIIYRQPDKKNTNLGDVFNLSDLQLFLNAELVQEVTAEDQRVAGSVHRVDPPRRDEKCVTRLQL